MPVCRGSASLSCKVLERSRGFGANLSESSSKLERERLSCGSLQTPQSALLGTAASGRVGHVQLKMLQISLPFGSAGVTLVVSMPDSHRSGIGGTTRDLQGRVGLAWPASLLTSCGQYDNQEAPTNEMSRMALSLAIGPWEDLRF